MRQWRVGSFSMGLILVLLGVGLLIDRFSGTPQALELVLNWWPLALILLGAEILAVNFLSKNGQFILKYDGWSILLVIVLFCFCLGTYAFSYTGVIPQIREALSISEHSCAIPDQEIDLAGIEKVTLSARGCDLELHSISGEKLTILGQATVMASSAESARKLAKQAEVEVKKVGDRLFIQINPVPGHGNIFRSNRGSSGRAIFIPHDLHLEVACSGYADDIKLNLDSLAAPWSVESKGPVRVNLARDLDLTLSGSAIWPKENLTGNADWENVAEEDASISPHPRVTGKITLGQGRWPLVIFSEQSIEANLLQVQ